MERLEERVLLSLAPLGPLPRPNAIPEAAAAASQVGEPDVGVASERVITTIAGTGQAGVSGDGRAATEAKLNHPEDVAVDLQGNVFIADVFNNRVREVTKNGKISSITGGGVFGLPQTVAIDPSVTDPSRTVLYVGENHGLVHKLVHTPGGWVTTLYAGGGDSSDDGVPATDFELSIVTGVAVDKNGDLYIADTGDRLFKVDHTSPHIIRSIIDGAFRYNDITSVAVDSQLNIFFTSSGSIYEADSQGKNIRRLHAPSGGLRAGGLAVSPTEADTVYFTEGNQVWKLSGGGKTLVAGNGEGGYDGDDGPPQNAKLNHPDGVAVDAAGNIYIADRNNHRVRAIKTPTNIVPTKLVFSPMPTGIVAGVPFQVVVTVQDDSGNIATKAKGTVKLSLTADHAEETELGGKLRVSVKNGVATFSVTLTNGTPQGPLTNGTPRRPMSSSPYYQLQADTTRFHAVSDKFGVIGYTPAQIRKFYGLNKLAPIRDKRDNTMKALDGTGQTIAIVVAYHHPNLYEDLDAFDQKFGLKSTGKTLYEQYGPADSEDGGFLTVLNDLGEESPLPGEDPGNPTVNPPRPKGWWESEEVMDVQWAHAIAPGADIIVIEADDSTATSLFRAIRTASQQPGVSVVSMSFGVPESYLGESFEKDADANTFTKNGVTFVSGSGDWGAPGLYPAYSPNVVAVGGTTLSAYWGTEKGWSGSGGGQSQYEDMPLYQRSVQQTTKRTIPDVSFLADMQTPAAVYNSHLKQGGDPWEQGGGTSLGTPAWAGIFAIVNQGRVLLNAPILNTDLNGQPFPTEANEGLYSLSSKDFRKPTGNYTDDGRAVNGTTKDNLLNLKIYDEVTGLGSPKANRLIPGLMEFNSHKRTRLAVASNSRALSGPAIEAVALACLPQSNSSLPSANLTVVDRSPLAAINGDASRFGSTDPAPVPLLETIQDATPTIVSTSRKPRSRFADVLFGAALDEIAFGRTLRDGELAAALLAASPVPSGTRDAALAEILSES